MYRSVTSCRACESARLTPVFNLGIQPLANDFCSADEEHAGYAPLKVLFCEACTLAQLSVVVDPLLLYRQYNYITSNSDSMARHFCTLANDIEHQQKATGSVLEIGSNDGRFLAYLKERGFGPVLGLDPADNLSGLARARGVETLSYLLTRASAEQAAGILGKVDNIIARHVFCHVDDWHEFLSSCEAIAHEDTLICLEVPYVYDLLKKAEFDTIYHEHTSYLSIEAMVAALKSTNLTLEDIRRYPVHGGAILLMIRKGRRWPGAPPDEVQIKAEDWRMFANKSQTKIAQLKSFVESLVQNGKTVAGYGASAKSTVWISACGFTERQIGFIADNTPQKIGKFSPGTMIPIVDEKDLLQLMPDYCVMFAWNFRDDVIEKNQEYLKAGGRFIVPSPELEVI